MSVYFAKESSEMLLEEEWLSNKQHQAYLKYIETNGLLGELATFLESAPVIKYFQKENI